jgi:excisionase family DNA binding protein
MGNAAEEQDRPQQQWFTTREAAEYIRVSRDTLLKLVERGHIRPDAPAGTRGLSGHRFSRATLDKYLSVDG